MAQAQNQIAPEPDTAMSINDASAAIAGLLDDDGRAPGHIEEGQARDKSDSREPDNERAHESRQRAPEAPEDDEPDDIGDTEDDENVDEAVGDDEGNDSDEDSADDSDAAGDSINTLAELAEASEMDLADFMGALTHTFTAAGEERTVTLAELQEGYQFRADYDRNKTALAQERQELEQNRVKQIESVHQQHAVASNQLQIAERVLIADMNTPEMQQLRHDDPAEWNARTMESQQKLAQLQQARQVAAQQYQAYTQQQRAEYMREEAAKLAAEVPDWGQDKLATAVDEIKGLGFSDSEVVELVDSRFFKAVLQLHDLKKEVETLREKVAKGQKAAATVKRTVPKVSAPGKAATPKRRGPDRKAISQARRRLAKTHHVRDAASAIEHLLE